MVGFKLLSWQMNKVVKLSWLLKRASGSGLKTVKPSCVLHVPEKDFNSVVFGISIVVTTA